MYNLGRDGSVGIATRCELVGPVGGREGRSFRIRPDRPWGPPSPHYNGYQVIPGCKATGGVKLIAILLLPVCAFVAYYRANFTCTFT